MAATSQQISAVLKTAGHPSKDVTASKIVEQLHQPILRAFAVTTRTKARLMLALVRQLLPVMEEIVAYDKEIERLFLTEASSLLFSHLPRAGKRLAPRRFSEIGDDRERYQDAASLQALAGTSPVPQIRGNYAKSHRRYACIKPLRNVLQQFGGLRTQTEQWARDSYERKRREGKSHSVAVRALANVWVRMLFAMWIKREEYQSAIFEQARREHASRAA